MANQLELGIHLGPQDIELDELRKLWRHCDEAGFDLITTWDHFYESPPRDGSGPTYEVKKSANIPTPVQERLPLIVGGGGEKRTLAIAARYADGSNQTYLTPEEYRHKNEVLDEWCERRGRDPMRLHRSIFLHFHMS